MVKKINALKARHRLGEMLEGVYYKNDQFIITRGDKPMAAVVSIQDFEAYQHQRQADFKVFMEIQESNKQINPDQIEQDVDLAIKAIRNHKGK